MMRRIPTPLKRRAHALLLVSGFLLLLTLGSASGKRVALQAGDPQFDVPQEQHALDSVAACANVPYGTLPAGHNGEVKLEGAAHFATPPNAEGPTLVDLGLFIIEVTNIDEVSSTFTVEGFMDMVWCDPREAFDPDELGWPTEIFLEGQALVELDNIWWPNVEFPNSSGGRDIENVELIVYPDGTIEYEERFNAQLEAHFDLRQFPFDSQRLEIEIESFAWDENFLIFHEETDRIGFGTDFQIPEWDTVAVETRIAEVQEIRDDVPFSELLMEIEVKRLPGFYIWKLIVPLALMVILSWTVFWMEEESVPERFYISLTGVLIVVAYQFATSGHLPRIATVTLMDSILIATFASLAAAAIENVLAGQLAQAGKVKLARQIDYKSRWVFPLAYSAAIAIIVLVYTL